MVHLHSSLCLWVFFCSRGDRHMHVYTWLHTFADIMFTFSVGTEHRVHGSSLWSCVVLHPLRHQSFKAGLDIEASQSIWIRVCNMHYWAIRTRAKAELPSIAGVKINILYVLILNTRLYTGCAPNAGGEEGTEEQNIGGQRSDNQVDHSIRESCRKTHISSEYTGATDRQHKACQLQI